MIREATHDDIPRLVELGARMTEEGRYAHAGYSERKAAELARHYIDSDTHLLLLAIRNDQVVGFFLGYVSEFFFSTAKVAGETLWYMAPEYRGCREGAVMIALYDHWARQQGAVEASAGVSLGVDDERAGRVLKRFGFVPSGAVYKRVY